jgi:hypothetical protein
MNHYNFNDSRSQNIRRFSSNKNAKENNIPDSSNSEMACYEMDDRGSFPDRSHDYSFLTTSSPALRSNPISYPMGTGGSFPRIDKPESTVGYPPPI